MKAYSVQNSEGGLIVLHETPGKAKTYAMGYSDWFSFDEYIDLTVTREKGADYLCKNLAGPMILEFCEYADLYHKLDWACYTIGECDSYSCEFKKDEDI